MSNAFLYRMPEGFAGAVTRLELAKIEPQTMDPNTPATLYGIPVKMVSGKIQPINSGSDVVYGLLVRPYPTQSTVNQAIGQGTPSTELQCDILRSGYMTVKVTVGTVAKNGQVYFNNTTGLIEGYVGSGQTAITGCFFQGTADSDGLVEVIYNI